MSISRAEQETSIVWEEEEKIANIYTCSTVTMRKLDKLCEQFPDEYKCIKTIKYQKKYTVPARYIRFGKPASEAMKERGRMIAQKRKETQA
jgi:hypothetical protein